MKPVYLFMMGDLLSSPIHVEINRICPPNEDYLLYTVSLDLKAPRQVEVVKDLIRAPEKPHTVAFATTEDVPRAIVAECYDRGVTVLIGIWVDTVFSHFEKVVGFDLTTERV